MADLDFGDVDHFYSKYYDLVLRSGFIGAAQDRTHRSIEKSWSKVDESKQVLEECATAEEHWWQINHHNQTHCEIGRRIFRIYTFYRGENE